MRLIKNKRYSNESKQKEFKLGYKTIEIISPLIDKVEEKIKENNLNLDYLAAADLMPFWETRGKELRYFLNIECDFYNKNKKSIEEVIKEFGIQESEIQKYESVWDKINEEFERKISYDGVTFLFTLNHRKSKYSDTMKVMNANNQFIISPELSLFYDFNMYGRSGNRNEIYIEGIPHFAIPAMMKFLAELITIKDVKPIEFDSDEYEDYDYQDDEEW